MTKDFTRQDLMDAIPNQEAIDAVIINRTWSILKIWKQFCDRAEDEPFYLEELSREGNDRRVKNPFWTDYKNVTAMALQALKELNLTPMARKTLQKKGGLTQLPTLKVS